MQLITEAYDILKRGFGMEEKEIAQGTGDMSSCGFRVAGLTFLLTFFIMKQSSRPGTRVSSTRS